MNIYIDDLAFEMALTQTRRDPASRAAQGDTPSTAKNGKPRTMLSALASVLTVTATHYSLPRVAEEWRARACC